MKYEYKIITNVHTDPDITEHELNKMGSHGYDLIGVYGSKLCLNL